MTQKAAAGILNIPTSTLSDLLHRSITRLREGHVIERLTNIGIDEIAYAKGKKYATIIYDLKTSRVVWVGKGKGRKTVDEFFRTLTRKQKQEIKWASCDLSETYINAIKYHCKWATLVIDRFHIVKALNGAMDKVRLEQWREVAGKKKKALKGLRWLLFKHSSKRTQRDNKTIKELSKCNRRIYRAWVLKDEFESFWDFSDLKSAKTFLAQWLKTAIRSRLKPIKTFVETIRKNIDNIITFSESRLTNAVAEGLNRIIKIVKNRASGFANLESFTDLIYLTVGDLNIPNQIPKEFQIVKN